MTDPDTQINDSEKGSTLYTGNDGPTIPGYLSGEHFLRPRERPCWLKRSLVFLALTVGLLVTARVIDDFVRAQFPTTPLPAGNGFLATPSAPKPSVKASVIPGESIAASVDVNGNRQVYDQDSEGKIWIRLSPSGSKKFSGTKQAVSIDPPPKAKSPLTAIAWAEGSTRSVS